jgi:APA family basic amino acid/polyamine antiporter
VEDIQDLFEKKIKPQKLDRSIGLFGATTIGVGALMGAGIYVLIGAAARAAGPSVIFSYLITGLLAFITTLMYAELSRIIPRSGGGYAYSYNILGSLGGFTTGWFLALGSIFASGLYALGFAEYAVALSGTSLSKDIIKLVAIGITLFIAYLNLRPTKNRKFSVQNWIVWGNVGILLLLIVVSFFHLHTGNAKPAFPFGFHGTLAAISLIYISFFGFQLIANSADEIIEPEKTIPKAMKLSMIISMAIYLFITVGAVLVVSWKQLASSDAPLVLLANEAFGGKGWILISLGGILASLGALSSTLFSQSRQTYAMGKDRFFPDVLGKLDEKTRQPKMALISGAILISLTLFFFNLEFIAKAANFCLLFSLLPVSLAMRKVYQKNPSLKPKSKWKHYLPQITLIINLGLLLTLDLVSLAFGQQLALIGAVIYFFYSRKREKRGKEGLNIILSEEKKFSFFSRNKVIIPVSNPNTQKELLMLSNTLLSKKGGEIFVLAIKNVPVKADFYEALAGADQTLEIIKRSIKEAKKQDIKITPIIRASYTIPQGIVNVAEEENSDLIIMGFPRSQKNSHSSITEEVLRSTHTDTLILNLKTKTEDFTPKKIGVYINNFNSLHLMMMCAAAIAEKNQAKIVLLGFLPNNFNKRQKANIDKLILKSLQILNSMALYDISLSVCNKPEQELIRQSDQLDLLIMGDDPNKRKRKSLEESFSFRVSKQSKCSAIVIRSIQPLKKFVQRL